VSNECFFIIYTYFTKYKTGNRTKKILFSHLCLYQTFDYLDVYSTLLALYLDTF